MNIRFGKKSRIVVSHFSNRIFTNIREQSRTLRKKFLTIFKANKPQCSRASWTTVGTHKNSSAAQDIIMKSFETNNSEYPRIFGSKNDFFLNRIFVIFANIRDYSKKRFTSPGFFRFFWET